MKTWQEFRRSKKMITSSSNQQIKNIALLNKKSKARREQGLFVVEGRKMFQEAPREWIRKVYLSESLERAHEISLDGIEYEVVDDRVFGSVCDTMTPQGILTLVQIPSYTEEQVIGAENPFLIVLEDLQDPGNVGTILRTAEGAGVTGVIVSRRTADLFQPKTIRATMGSIYRMPFLQTEDPVQFLSGLSHRGIRTFAAHLRGIQSYRAQDYTGPCAILIGNEGNGLSDGMAEQADVLVRIPMEGQVESLNAAIASAVFMYEVHGQRHPEGTAV